MISPEGLSKGIMTIDESEAGRELQLDSCEQQVSLAVSPHRLLVAL